MMNTDPDFLRQNLLMFEHADQLGSPDDQLGVGLPGSGTEPEGPSLSIDTTLRQATRGRGQVVSVACARDVVCVATSRGYVLQYRWDDYGNEKVHEVEVAKSGSDAHIEGMWLDPTACHIMLSVRAHGVYEVHYLYSKWPRARPLARLRGTRLTALAWPPSALPAALNGDATDGVATASNPPTPTRRTQASSILSETCTGSMLLGTDAGLLHELIIEEATASRKEPGPPHQLLDFKDARKAICGLHQAVTADDALLVVVATPLALYLLRGPAGAPSLEALATLHAHAGLQPALEAALPGATAGGVAPPHSQLQFYIKPGEPPGATDSLRFGWLVGDVVYHGEILTAASPADAAPAPPTPPPAGAPPAPPTPKSRPASAPDSLLRGVRALPLLQGEEVAGGGLESQRASTPYAVGSMANSTALDAAMGHLTRDDDIQAMVMTEWHFLVVVGDHLRAVNRVSGRCAAQRGFRSPLMTKVVAGEPARTLDGLVVDPVTRAIYIYSDESLYEVQLRSETQGLWRVFMELQDWEPALRLASSPSQRDVVHSTKAEAAFAARDYDTAALHFAKVLGGHPPFEDITLRLIEAEAPGALMLFLTTRMSCLSKTDRAQATMLASWILELRLDGLNKMLLQSGGVPTPEYAAAEMELHAFLAQSVDTLDTGTAVALLAAAGRTAELLVYATARQDHAAVLEALLQRPDGAQRALAVLRKPSCPQELLYRFAPGLLVAAPEPFVDLVISARPALEPRRLIPALLRFAEPGAAPAGRAAVLRYVTFAIEALESTDSAVHDLAAALYSLEPGEAQLLSYIARGRSLSGIPLFDPRYVLRLAAERGKLRCEVKLLCELGMYEDAVARALLVDLALAQSVAGAPPEEDTHLRHRLWLAVAQHVVQGSSGSDQAAAIQEAVQLLKEAGGLLKIEDVLPFFPDFVTIDNFKDAICDSLERYNKQIDELKAEMEEATAIAEAVRKDLTTLGSRTAVVSLAEACARCRQPLGAPPLPAAAAGLPTGGLIPPFFVFPTGLVYHGVCCAAEVASLAPDVTLTRLKALMQQLSQLASESEPNAKAMLRELRELVASEDPRNGGQLVRLTDLPFLGPEDDAELQSWAL